MSRGLTFTMTWLVAAAMALAAILPPIRLDCRCAAPADGVSLGQVDCAQDESVDACCAPAAREGDALRESSTPPSVPDEHGCECEGACCVYAQSVLVDGDSASGGKAKPTVDQVAMTGPQTSAAAVHAGTLLRPPRA